MPFKKVGPNKNVSPSGKVFTDKQVKFYTMLLMDLKNQSYQKVEEEDERRRIRSTPSDTFR